MMQDMIKQGREFYIENMNETAWAWEEMMKDHGYTVVLTLDYEDGEHTGEWIKE